MPNAKQALEAFVDPVQNPELAQLKGLLKRFNLFEAVGVVNHELRHSDFLAFLLDPSQNHGLGGAFLSAFLQAVSQTATGDSCNLDFDNLSNASVQREWHYIDILVVDDLNRFGIVLENKIGTGEHSGQLNRYRAAFDAHYPGYKVLALYLTPDGDMPSSPDYQAVSYSVVCEVIENIVRVHRGTLDREVTMALEHYAQLLRRHVLSDSDIAILCRSIYQKHKQALDLIFEHKPDQPELIRQYIDTLIQQQPDMTFDPKSSHKSHTIFSLREWQNSPRHGGETGDNICWMLFFCFNNEPDKLSLDLQICPGDEDDRQRHLKMAQEYHFTGFRTALRRRYSPISSVLFLSRSDYENSQEQIEALIAEKWEAYLHDELPRIVNAVCKEKWLWELPQNTL